ncbi:MAG: sensor domain-containing diguanylate cyclase, partial [Burkholderiales bacterium]|nr:sensor domain-containing diguanylate cyclase [Burkholderiales bacterium]
MPPISLGTHLTALLRSKYMARAAISIGVVLLAGLFGWAFVSTYEGRIHNSRHQAERELQAISLLQADGVASWREQRFADAHALVDDVLLARAVVDWRRDASPEHTQLVQGRLRILQERARYAAVYLSDAAGLVQLATDDVSPHKLPAPEQAALQAALAQARATAVEPRTDPTFAFPFFSVVA